MYERSHVPNVLYDQNTKEQAAEWHRMQRLSCLRVLRILHGAAAFAGGDEALRRGGVQLAGVDGRYGLGHERPLAKYIHLSGLKLHRPTQI